ncbi:HTTM domain-containing protein [Flavobacterium terrigena]|uniref:Vitamin K-dependent gamma-carboxylase n=1 Tax=Flavobacterium terrigena TaxID=402734 RepID=A0A1H6XE38_9FLAO|nr:HTTM domain-containing protein [Flavobacterium terrigena]SEJ27388.1 Vitamin K-dependent gamma-carboxylase [Flavobacterium terrigena]
MKKWLAETIDNSGLVIFRILLGLLIASESFGAILLGWVEAVFVQSKFTFNFIGFDFLQVLHGEKMYAYFFTMGILGLLITFGLFYRFVMIAFTIMWTAVYLIQKEHYNNHYYFLILICIIMIFLPANGKLSVDAKLFPKIKQTKIPRWMPYLLIFQLAILYFYAAIAKLYPDWLDGTFSRILLNGITQRQFLLDIFNQKWFLLTYAYIGILFDLLILPALLWKKTRKLAIIASFGFHLFNAYTLKIGIFPFLALSFIVLLYDSIPLKFLNKKEEILPNNNFNTKLLLFLFVPFFIVQLILPLRHHFIKGDVLFTEEGHRLSWRMMLRERKGFLKIKVVDKNTGVSYYYNYAAELTPKQIKILSNSPDVIWQYCQKIKKESKKPISIFVECEVSINRRPFYKLINEKTDMATAKFNYFAHNDWVLLQNLN